jgi:hypothetical protein
MDGREFRPEVIYAELLAAGGDWADKNAAADLLEESRHSILAECRLKSDAKTEAAKETDARADKDYRAHIAAMVAARHAANTARVRYEAVKTLAELRRSEESTRRAEMGFVRQGGAG